MLCFYFRPFFVWEMRHKKNKNAIQPCSSTTSLSEDLSYPLEFKHGGGHVHLFWMQKWKQWQAASFPPLFSPSSISSDDSFAKVLSVVNKTYPLSEPAACSEALLGFVCRLGGNLMTAEEPLKWPLVFNRENATSAVIILDLCQEPLDRRRYCSASSHFDRLCRCSCPCRHVKSCQHPQRSLLLLLALARHRHERGWIIHEWENT